jgi:hypothetical protein
MIKAIIGLALIFIPIYLILMVVIQGTLKANSRKNVELKDANGLKNFTAEAFIGAAIVLCPILGLTLLFWK